jgi:N-acetyl sugar amidotransferase
MADFVRCSRCILDTTVKDIWFDKNNECKYCKIHDELETLHPPDNNSGGSLSQIIKKIIEDGKGRKYNCIAGVSGGRDSTYTLLTAKRLGLNPLAVHFDNGWNSEISVKNIKKACEKLNVDLVTIVADWEEFKDLQVSFLKAATPDADIPTDYAIYSVLYHMADKEGVQYILNGHSFRTEGTSPISWTYMDPLYVKSVHKQFGKIKKFKSFPHMTFLKLQYYIWIKGIKEIRLMEHMNYNKNSVDNELAEALDWQYYGGHHHENLYTKFFQSYYLPEKFNIDKRKTELSALVRSGQISREEALKVIETNPYKVDPDVVRYTISKLGLSEKEWNDIMKSQNKTHDDYPTYLPVIRSLKWFIKITVKLKLLPQILYLKYAS